MQVVECRILTRASAFACAFDALRMRVKYGDGWAEGQPERRAVRLITGCHVFFGDVFCWEDGRHTGQIKAETFS